MNTAFVVSGLLLLVGVTGAVQSIRQVGAVARRTCSALLALSPLGVILDGIFTLESMPLHSVGFFLAAATPVLSFLVAGLLLRRVPRWRRFGNWLLLGSPLTLALLVLVFTTFQSDDIWGWARSGRFGTTRIDHRGPRVVRGPRLVGLQPLRSLATPCYQKRPSAHCWSWAVLCGGLFFQRYGIGLILRRVLIQQGD
jgi:uncharacterized membrane protein